MKKPMTTNEERNNESMNPISLCIALLSSSKIFQDFVTSNNLEGQLREIANNTNRKENDIAKMLMDILDQLNSQ